MSLLTFNTVTAHVVTTDIARAKNFYENKLGLIPHTEVPVPKGYQMYKCGGNTTLLLYERPTKPKADHTLAGWWVDDISKTVQELSSEGVKFEKYDIPGGATDEHGITSFHGSNKTAWFKDPDGNILSINELGAG